MCPDRDELAWIFLREKDQSVSAVIYHFAVGVIRAPDRSAIPKSSLARWASNTNTAIQIAEYPGNGLRYDREPNELVITDPHSKQLKPVMNFMVEVVDSLGFKTLFPFKILAGPKQGN